MHDWKRPSRHWAPRADPLALTQPRQTLEHERVSHKRFLEPQEHSFLKDAATSLAAPCGALKAHVYLLETTAYSIFLLNRLQAPASPAWRSEISWQSRGPARSPRRWAVSALGRISRALLLCFSQFNLLPFLLPCCPAPSRGLWLVPGVGRGCWHYLVTGTRALGMRCCCRSLYP